MDDTIQYVRVANLVLGSVAALWLISRSWLRRKDYPHTITLFLQVLALYILSATYGSIEALSLNSDALLRPFIILGCHVAMLVVLGLTQKRRVFAVRVRG